MITKPESQNSKSIMIFKKTRISPFYCSS